MVHLLIPVKPVPVYRILGDKVVMLDINTM